jgi:site-specific DNA-cytosine methylase
LNERQLSRHSGESLPRPRSPLRRDVKGSQGSQGTHGKRGFGDLTPVNLGRRPAVDLVTAGFACQHISTAGRGADIKEGTRTGLWTHIAQALA